MDYVLDYTTAALNKEPKIHVVDGKWNLQYMAFSHPEHTGKTPLIMLGGAFQDARCFKYEMDHYLEAFPVILLDLPSQGSNAQLAGELSLEDLSELIKSFVDSMQLSKISLAGFSYGSALAALFAGNHPEYMHRLLLAGTTTGFNKRVSTLLSTALRLMDEGKNDAFASLCTTGLLNHNRLQETELRPSAAKLLHRQIMRLNDNERARYRQNTNRLLSFQGFNRFPTCETMVTTGEFDSFTQPQENAHFAAQCENASFALIDGADHLPPFQRREETTNFFKRYLTGLSLKQVPGITFLNHQQVVNFERRSELRQLPKQTEAMLSNADGSFVRTVELFDINFFGCSFKLTPPSFHATEQVNDLTLTLVDTHGELIEIPMQVMERQSLTLRCAFAITSIELAHHFKAYLVDAANFVPALEETAAKLA